MSKPIWYPNMYVVEFGLTAPGLRTGQSVWSQAMVGTRTFDAQFFEDLEDEWDDAISPFVDNSVSLTSIRVLTETEEFGGPVSVVGKANYQLAPPNVSIIISRVNAYRGPRAQSRFFPYGHVDESAINESGDINPTNRADLQGAYGQLMSALVGDNDTAVVQPRTGGISPPPSDPYPIVGWVVEPKVATQRRRLRR